ACAVFTQIEPTPCRWKRQVVAHITLPQDTVEQVCIDVIGVGEIKAFGFLSPPRSVMQLRRCRRDLRCIALAGRNQFRINRSGAQVAWDDRGVWSEVRSL